MKLITVFVVYKMTELLENNKFVLEEVRFNDGWTSNSFSNKENALKQISEEEGIDSKTEHAIYNKYVILEEVLLKRN